MVALKKPKQKVFSKVELKSQINLLEKANNRYRLTINSLENELQSMTGARDNCRRVMEWTNNKLEEKKIYVHKLEVDVQALCNVRAGLSFELKAARSDLRELIEEKPVDTITRGFNNLYNLLKHKLVKLFSKK